MTYLRMLALGLVTLATLVAQVTHSVSVSSSNAADVQLYSGPSTGGISWSNGSAANNLIYLSPSGSSFGAVPPETRKDDGRGPTKQDVVRSAKLISEKQTAPAGYLELAKAIGLDPSPMADEARLVRTVQAHTVKVYDHAKVDDYLWRLALRQGARTRWVWKPVRKSDLEATKESQYRDLTGVGYVWGNQYARVMPKRVLELMACILADSPEAVFLASDFEVFKPDPFLAVTTKELLASGKIWIIAVWDEPGFREETDIQ